MGGACGGCARGRGSGARYCADCGTALLTPSGGVRKTVTVLFSDVLGLPALVGELDPEAARRTTSELYAAVREVLEDHGATVEKYAGDAVMAVFGVPVAHEDDALRAASAALALTERTAEVLDRVEAATGHRLALRSALNTGEVLSERDASEGLVLGDAVVVAARLLQHAEAGDVLVGPDTAQLVRTTVVTGEPRELVLRGRAGAVRAHPLVAVRPTPAHGGRTDLVGRDADTALLGAALQRVVRGRSAQLVTVVGEAGVGKSRLVDDLLATAAGSGVFVRRVRCRSYGARVRWSPLPALLDGLPVDALPDDAQRVLAALRGDGPAPQAAEVAWALGLQAAWLSEQAPCAIVLEDLHGAEPEALEVVQEVVRRLEASPVLVVVTARPSLHDVCPSWGAGLRQAMSLRLSPLDPSTARRLAASLLAPAEAPAVVLDRLVEAAGGNPLFLEHVVSMLVESGQLVRDGSAWRLDGGVDALELPPTVRALLAARLDRLPAAERHVLERGALLGKEFAVADLLDLVDDGLRDELPELLAALGRRELVRGSGRSRAFPSSLVRKAAYAGLPRAERARLHERVGRSLAQRPGQDELAGGHLEQAVRHLDDIGVPDEGLREAAGELLARAGTRALTGDALAAQALLQRATALMTTERRLRTVPDLARVQALTGDLAGAEALLREAVEEARAVGADVAVAHARLALLDLLRSTRPEAAVGQTEALVAEVLPLLRDAGDDRGLSLAWQLQAGVHQYHVRWAAMEEPLERALLHARRAGDDRLAELAQSLLVGSLFHGPTPVAEVHRRLRHMVAAPGISRSHRASVAARLAGTLALQGEVAEAVAELDEVREVFLSLGRHLSAAATAFMRGPVLLLADRPDAAAAVLDESCRVLDGMGDRAYGSTLRALLAEARWRCGDAGGAQAAVDACRRAAADGDVITQLRWRAVQAKLCAAAGDAERGRGLADAAVRLAARTDEVVSQGDVLCDRAEVRSALGDDQGAQADLRDAVARYDRKGAVQSVRRLAGRLVIPTDLLPEPGSVTEPAPA